MASSLAWNTFFPCYSCCKEFWIPLDASFGPHCAGVVGHVPSWISLGVFLLRYTSDPVWRRRPLWLRRFAAEADLEPAPAKKRPWTGVHTLLATLSLVGVVVGVAGAVSGLGASQIFVVPCVVSLLILVIDRPRSTPGALLAIHGALALVQLALAMAAPGLIGGWAGRAWLGTLAVPLLSVLVILHMPMRDPDLPSDNISTPFSLPTATLRSPEDGLTLWQWLTVSWMGPLIATGVRRQLHEADVWALPFEFQHGRLHQLFREVRGSVVERLLQANGPDLLATAGLGVLESAMAMSSVVFLKQLLGALEERDGVRSALVYALLTLLARWVAAQSGVLSLWFSRRAYERSRGEMITMIYEKTLRRKAFTIRHGGDDSGPPLSLWRRVVSFFRSQPKESAASPASTGKILNLMRNDVYEVAQRFWEFSGLVTKPLNCALALALLWRFLGPASLLGVAVLVACQLGNALLVRILLRVERSRRAATDAKLQLTSQFVEAIRHLRWYDWQDAWLRRILASRQLELDRRLVASVLGRSISTLNNVSTFLFPVAGFYGYTVLAGRPLTVDVAFPAMDLFTMLETSLRELPDLVAVLLNARVAVGRIEGFMGEGEREEPGSQEQEEHHQEQEHEHQHQEEHQPLLPQMHQEQQEHQHQQQHEHQHQHQHQHQQLLSQLPQLHHQLLSQPQMQLHNASFSWPGGPPALHSVSASFSPGLTLVCGQVGSGKTALLHALLGEMDQTCGSRSCSSEPIGYCAQSPWLQSMSIRDNILFSAPHDPRRYRQTLAACCLLPDLATFEAGDLSPVGENGIGLSGGQRARVALARAVYSRARVLLLDDPVAALDHQTASAVLRRLFGRRDGLMAGRLVVLVTHRVDLASRYADQVVDVGRGRVTVRAGVDAGKVEEEEVEEEEEEEAEVHDDNHMEHKPTFIQDEHRATGGVMLSVYWRYVKAGSLRWWAAALGAFVVFRMVRVVYYWYLKRWSEAYSSPSSPHSLSPSLHASSSIFSSSSWLDIDLGLPSPAVDVAPWLRYFLLLSLAHVFVYALSDVALVVVTYRAGKRLFEDVMRRVAYATFRFYDVTPTGRLMNRVTSDAATVDGQIAAQLTGLGWSGVSWISSVVVVAAVAPLFLVLTLAMSALFVYFFARFLPASQSLRRLEMVSLSPLMSNFGALLDGLTTVRAFAAQPHFQDRIVAATDRFQGMDHFYWSLQAWLAYRLDVLSAAATFCLTAAALASGLSSGSVGFVLAAAGSFVTATHSACRKYGEMQMQFVSVERVVELLDLEQEPRGDRLPPAAWPTYADDVAFESVTLRYAPDLAPSLENVSFRVPAGSTVAVVGRTGSGKSTLALSLLGVLLPDEGGSISIGGIDVARVDKRALRSAVSFVAQDPVLFPGSVRDNLDPLRRCADEECDSVLARIFADSATDLSLDSRVDGGGKNLSQGQRQLVALGRAILRRSPVVILDEATASIDVQTALHIQEVLREELRQSTVITIAHRVEAVKDADYRIVLEGGRLVECGRI